MSDIRLVKKDSSDKLENIKFGISAAGVQKIEAEAKNYINTLQKYSDKVDRQEYFSSDDLKGYKAAMDGYINSNNRLRRLNKSFGNGFTEEEEKQWNDCITSLQNGYTDISNYFSYFKTEKEFKDAMTALKQREKLRAEDQEMLQSNIDEMKQVYNYWDVQARYPAPANANKIVDIHQTVFNPNKNTNGFVEKFKPFNNYKLPGDTNSFIIPFGVSVQSNNKKLITIKEDDNNKLKNNSGTFLNDIVEQKERDKYAGMTLGQLKNEIEKEEKYLSQVRYIQNYFYLTENDVSLGELKSHLKDEDPIAYTDVDGTNVTWKKLYDDKKYEEDFNSRYEEYSSKDDWSEKSKYYQNNTQNSATSVSSFFDDNMDWRYEHTANWFPMPNKEDKYYSLQMKEKEKRVFNYIYHTKGAEAAYEWHDSIVNILKEREKEKRVENNKKFAEKVPVLSDIASIVANTFSGAEYIGNLLAGNGVEESKLATFSQNIRSTRAEQIDWEIGDWDAFDFLYNTGMSMADSAASQLAFGKAGGIALGLSAAGQGVNDALNRGLSSKQAFWHGFASGAFEMIFETVSIGQFNALKDSLGSGAKNAFKNIAKSMLVNASDETITELANIAYDTMVNADFSNYETMVRTYVMNGMSIEDAEAQAKNDMKHQIAEAMASGALMGFGFGSIGSVAASINAAVYGKYYYGFSQKSTYALVENGLAMPEGSEAYKLAIKSDAKLKKGKNLSGTALYNLVTAIESEIETKSKTRFSELGIDKKTAKELSPIVAKVVFGEKLSSAEHSRLNNSVIAVQVVKELSADRANTIWKDAKKNNSVNFSISSDKNTILHSESNDNIINNVGDDYVDEKVNAKDIEKISQVDVLSNVSGESHRTDNESYENKALNELELAAVLKYKSSASYLINDLLRNSENLSDVEAEFVRNMDDALIKMPTYQGTVYRNIAFDWFGGQEAYDAFLSEHKVGYVVNYLAFTSASIKEDGYLVDGRFAVSMVIESGNAKNVDGYGNNFESEVIFPRNSVFVVNNVKYNDKGQPIIYMTEVIKNDEGKHGQFYSKERSEVVQSLSKSQPRYSDLQDISEDNTTRCYDRKNYLQSVSGKERGLKEFDYEEIEKLKESFEDRVESRLLELGIDNKTTKALSPIVAKAVFGEKLSSAEHSTLNNSEIATQVVKELSADRANTVWKDAIKNSRNNNVDENNAVTEQGDVLQLSATDVVDSVNDFNYNDNSIKEGEYYNGEDTKLLERGTVSATDRGDDILRESGTNSETLAACLEVSYRSDEPHIRTIWAGECGWLAERATTTGKKTRESFKESIHRRIRGIRLSGKDTIGGIVSPKILEKFKNTICKDENGNLISLYHWTSEIFETFSKGEFGFHFGTLQAANERYLQLKEENPGISQGVYKEVILNITNPIEISDEAGEWNASWVAFQLLQKGIISEQQYDSLSKLSGFDDNTYDNPAAKAVREILAQNGYDGIIYENLSEDTGSYSFIALYPEQIITIAENGVLKENSGVSRAISNEEIASFDSGEKQTNGIDADEFIKGLRGEDDSDSDVLQSNADIVVDGDIAATQHNENSKLQSNKKNNIINSVGDIYVDEETNSENVREIREKYFRKIGDDFQGGISETAETFSERTRRNSLEGSGQERLLLNEGKLIVAYTPVKDDNSPKHIFFKKLREYGIDIYYCNGVIETNVDGITMVHDQAITTRGGKIFVSSVATVEFKSMMDHELVHWKMRMFSDSYFEYEDIVLRNLNRESNYYIAFCEELNLREYNNKYNINTIEGAIVFNSEITAYVYQYVLNDSNFAENFFSKMFFDWHNVKNAVKRFNSKMEINTELFNQVGSYDESAFFAYKNKIENNTTEQGDVLQSTADGVVDSDTAVEAGVVQSNNTDSVAMQQDGQVGSSAAPGVVEDADGKQYFDDGSGDEYFGDTSGDDVAHGGDEYDNVAHLTTAEGGASPQGEGVDSENAKDLQLSEPALQDIARAPTAEESIAAAISNEQLDTKQRRVLDFVEQHFPEITLKFSSKMTKGGLWDPESKTLLLNTNQTVAGMYIEVLKHEFMHRLESKRLYQEFKQYLFNKDVTFGVWAKVRCKVHGIELTQNATAKEAISKLTEYYHDSVKNDMAIAKKYREAFTMDGAQREMVADFFGEIMFNGKKYRTQTAQALADETFITIFDENERAEFQASSMAALAEIAEYKPNIFQQIVDWVKRIILKLRGTRIKADAILADELERNIKMLEDYVKQVYYSRDTKKAAENGGVEYSLIGRTVDGRGIYKTNYEKNTPKSIKQADLISLVQNVWRKHPITLEIIEQGITKKIIAKFNPELSNRSDLSKIAFGNRKGNASDQRMTLDLSSDLYQIASDAKYLYSKDAIPKPENPAHEGVAKYHYFLTNLVYKDNENNYIDCHMNIDVKQNSDGNWFYSFGLEKGSAPQTLLAAVTEKSATLPSNIISNFDEDVNTEKSNDNNDNSNQNPSFAVTSQMQQLRYNPEAYAEYDLELSEPALQDIARAPTAEEAIEEAITGKQKTNIQRHIVDICKKLFPNITVEFVDKIDEKGKIKGKFIRSQNKILIRSDLNAVQMYVEVFKHEFMHRLETKALYSKFFNYCFKKSKAFEQYVRAELKAAGFDIDAETREGVLHTYTKYKYEQYKNAEGIPKIDRDAFTMEMAREEIIADFFAQILFQGKEYRARIIEALENADGEALIGIGDEVSSEAVLMELQQKEPTLLEQLRQWIRDIIDKLRGMPQAKSVVTDLEYMESLLTRVYNSRDSKRLNRQKQGEVKYSFGVTQNDIDDYVDAAYAKENTEDYKKYAIPTEKLINDVSDEIDISDYVHALRDNDIRHIKNSHGEETNEKYPVTIDDIKLIPWIVQNYDKVFVIRREKGKTGIIYVKVNEDGLIYFLEQVTTIYGNEPLLVNKQMIKTGIEDIPNLKGFVDAINKKESEAEFLADLKKVHEVYAQSVYQPHYNINISNHKENVKRNNVIKKKMSSSQYLADLNEIRKAYVQDVKENYSNFIIPNSFGNVNIEGNNGASLDQYSLSSPLQEFKNNNEFELSEPDIDNIEISDEVEFLAGLNGVKLSKTQKHIVDICKNLDSNITVEFVDNLETNGKFIRSQNKILIRSDLSVVQMYVEVFKHEFMHRLETKALYSKFFNYCFKKSKAFEQYIRAKTKLINNNIDDMARESVLNLYTEYKYNQYINDKNIPQEDRDAFTMEMAKEEIIADFFAQILFQGKQYRARIINALENADGESLIGIGDEVSSEAALMELQQKEPTLLEQLRQWIRDIIDKLRGIPQAKSLVEQLDNEINQLESMVRKAYQTKDSKRLMKKKLNEEKYLIAGEKSQTANHSLLFEAKLRDYKGEDSESIRRDTGWYKGRDGKWRYYIPDNELNIDQLIDFANSDEDVALLGDVIVHNKLFAAYPELRNLSICFEDMGQIKRGKFLLDKNEIVLNAKLKSNGEKIKDTLVHEIQNAIQHIEVFARGGNKNFGFAYAMNMAYDEAKNTSEFNTLKTKEEKYYYLLSAAQRIFDAENPDELQYKAYRAIYGEVEARHVTRNRLFNDELLRYATPDIQGNVVDKKSESTKFVENFTEMGYTEKEILKFFRGVTSDESRSVGNIEKRSGIDKEKSKFRKRNIFWTESGTDAVRRMDEGGARNDGRGVRSSISPLGGISGRGSSVDSDIIDEKNMGDRGWRTVLLNGGHDSRAAISNEGSENKGKLLGTGVRATLSAQEKSISNKGLDEKSVIQSNDSQANNTGGMVGGIATSNYLNTYLLGNEADLKESAFSVSIGEHRDIIKPISSWEKQEIEKICNKFGIDIVFEDLRDMVHKGEILSPDGYIEKDKEIIHLNLYAENPIGFILKHELTHFGEKSSRYIEFVKAVKKSKLYKKWITEKTGESDLRIAEYKYKQAVANTHSDIYGAADPKAEAEMIADFVGEMLFTENGSGMAALTSDLDTKQRNAVIQFILDFISWIKKKLGDMGFTRLQLEVLEHDFNELLMDASVQQAASQETIENSHIKSDIKYCFAICNDKETIEAAERMEAEDQSSFTIFEKLKVIKNVFGTWLVELNADKFRFYPQGNALMYKRNLPNKKLNVHNGIIEGKLKDFIIYKPLFERYPSLRNLRVVVQKATLAGNDIKFVPGNSTLYISSQACEDYMQKKTREIKVLLLEMLQRIILHIEGTTTKQTLDTWKAYEADGKMPYSEFLGRNLTAQEVYDNTYDNYIVNMTGDRQRKKNSLMKKGKKLVEIQNKMLYQPFMSNDIVVFDENGNPVTAKEYADLKEVAELKSKQALEGDLDDAQSLEFEKYENLNSESENFKTLDDTQSENNIQGDENSFEMALEKNKNSNQLRHFLKMSSMINRYKVTKYLNIKAGSDDLISAVADNAKLAAEQFNQERIKELSQKPLQRFDTVGRMLNDWLLEKFKDTFLKNEKGQLISLYTLKMSGKGGFKHSKLGLIAGTLASVEQLYAEYNKNYLQNCDVYVQEIFVDMKNPLVLDYTPYEDSIHGLHDLVDRGIITHNRYVELTSYRWASIEANYNGYITKTIREYIKAAGYDGIIYRNNTTDKGSMSVVIFDESQIVTVAENGVLQQGNGIIDDYFDLTAAEEAARKINNGKNIKLFASDYLYKDRVKRSMPDERIKAGSSDFMERVAGGQKNALKVLLENLADKSNLKLTGKDTVGRALGQSITNKCSGTYFKDQEGNLISFFAYSRKIIDIYKAVKKGKTFGTLDSAIRILVSRKENVPWAFLGTIQEFYINSVAPIVFELDEWNTEVIAKRLFEEMVITKKEYYKAISGEYKNPELMLTRRMDVKGYDSIIFVKKSGEYEVMPFNESQIIPVAENGIAREDGGINQIEETNSIFNENYKMKKLVIDGDRNYMVDISEIKKSVLPAADNTTKLQLLTKILMGYDEPAIDFLNDRNAGHSGSLEKSKFDVWNARAIMNAVINRDLLGVLIADTDTAGRIVSEYKRALLSESKLIDNDGRPLSVFVFNYHGDRRFEYGQYGLRVGTLNAAHDMSLFHKEKATLRFRGLFEEYYAIVKKPFHIMFDPQNSTPATLARYAFEEGVITDREYAWVLSIHGANETTSGTHASIRLIKILKERGFDSISFMNKYADPGSLGIIVFDKSQLIPVAIDGLPVENSDRTLADSDNEAAFFISKNSNEKNVENSDEDFLDAIEDKEYNGDAEQLTNTEKLVIEEKTGWSDEIIDCIRSMEEAQIYIDADLKEAQINGRKCLIRDDIDIEQKNEKGITNRELIMLGKSPINIYGEKVELHHIGQKQYSPFAELTEREHHSKGNYRILHIAKKQTEIVRNIFNLERKKHWQIRAEIKGGNYE